MRSQYSSVVLALACVAGLATGAKAQDLSGFMAEGAPTAPPAGFLVLCETSPQDCVADRGDAAALSAVRAWASRTRWQRTFADAGISIGDPAGRSDLTPNTLSASTNADVGAAIREARAAEKAAARKAAARRPAKPGPGKPTPAKPAVGALQPPPAVSAPSGTAVTSPPPVRIRDLEAVNRRINWAIRRSSDEATFGAADVWAAPTGPRPRGDCEDYALAKRRALIETGVDPDLLSLAIVRTRGGEIHAVLLVRAGDGEYVLDNLSPWVVRWDSAPYDWLERQTPGAPLVWTRLEGGDPRRSRA
ncbi:transglutaminase-like cysteine peptidase [Brevundimonas sp.]|uniref:transglutaminase-like cysteine peptidase n=1 Tax=Brevundimonas sp. TaxID=1871086 RepID=UPI00286C00B9|nr:transglutaminase-like cysteine peptidase [Brevundimonas sp.]